MNNHLQLGTTLNQILKDVFVIPSWCIKWNHRKQIPGLVGVLPGCLNVERTIAHLTRHGAHKTRLGGTVWAKFKLAIHGAIRNIMTIPRLLE